MRIVSPGDNCLVDFANFVNPTADIPGVPGPPCPTASAPPSGPGPNPNDPLNGVPIVFWGAPVGTGPITPGSLPPVIPTNFPERVRRSTGLRLQPQPRLFRVCTSQDQWRVNPKLTLNYGLRWDEEFGLSKIVDPRPSRLSSPGWAWPIHRAKHTVIRTGFGVFDDHYNMTFFFVTYPQREVVIPNAAQPWVRQGNSTATWVLNQLSFDAPSPLNGFAPLPYPDGFTVPNAVPSRKNADHNGSDSSNPNTGPGPGQDSAIPSGSFVTNSGGGIDRNMRLAYSEQASLQIDQEIGNKDEAVSVGYLFLRAHKQIRPENLNVCPSAGLTDSATTCFAADTVPGPPITPTGPNNQMPDGKAAFSGVLYNNAGLMYYLDGSGNAQYDGGTLSR